VEDTLPVLQVQAVSVYNCHIKEVPEDSKPPAPRLPTDGIVGLLLVVLVHPTHELVISWQGRGTRYLFYNSIFLPFPRHCLISGYRIGIGDQVDLLMVLPNCHCHTPLGPKHIISSLHRLQRPFVQKLRGGFELVRANCPHAENLIYFQILHKPDTGEKVVHVDDVVFVCRRWRK